MKKYIFVFSTIIFLLLSLPDITNAQVGIKKVGQSTMNFLKVSVSPEAASMGGVSTTTLRDAQSIFYNPAGLAGMSGNYSAFVSNTRWIADINYFAGAVAKNFGTLGTFAMSFLSVDYGDIQGANLLSSVDPQGYETTGNIDVGAYAFGIGYARNISDQFSIGGQVQYVGQNLGSSILETGTVDNQVNKLTYNFGMRFYPGFESFRFAMSIRNFAAAAQYEEVAAQLPLVFSMGLAMDMLDIISPSQNNTSSFTLGVEFLHPNNYTERLNIGGEYSFLNDLIAARAGYEFNTDLQGLSAGFGVSPKIGNNQIELQYSYSQFDVFDGVNRFSLVASF